MFQAGASVASMVTKWVFRFGFIMATIVAFVVLLNMAFSMVLVGLNFSVVADVLHMIQLWLPFNLNVLIAWVLASSVAYVTYRLAVLAFAYVTRLVSD